MERKPGVLVVEDDPALAALVARCLHDARITVYPVPDGHDAFHLLSRVRVDVALVDNYLPDVDVAVLVTRIKDAVPDRNIPVILITRGRPAVEAFALGADDYLVRPFSTEELLSIVSKWLPPGSTENAPEDASTREKIQSLSPSERVLINLLGHGLTNRDIGERLGVSEIAVREVLESILRTLGLDSRLELVILAFRHGLVEGSSIFSEVKPLPEVDYDFSDTSVVSRFDFPEAVKVPCEQYLLYFVEFLRDIGIKASANLSEQAGKVLFSVTPDELDKEEALANIREALDIYLHLPMVRPSQTVITGEESIEALKLQGQISHLQSQLQLNSAVIQAQQLTIRQRDDTIYQQQILIEQHIASGNLLVQSRQETGDDAGSLAGGLVRAKPWSPNNIPVEINFPELIRMLRERFRRKNLPYP